MVVDDASEGVLIGVASTDSVVGIEVMDEGDSDVGVAIDMVVAPSMDVVLIINVLVELDVGIGAGVQYLYVKFSVPDPTQFNMSSVSVEGSVSDLRCDSTLKMRLKSTTMFPMV